MRTLSSQVFGFPSSLLLAIALAGCGGGGGSDTSVAEQPVEPPPLTVKGIEGGGVLKQFSQGLTELSVGGKQLDVTDPGLVVTVDSVPATLETLRVGDRIFYSGTTSDDGATIVVTSIVQDDLVEGRLDVGSLDLDAGSFSVLGQMVLVTPLTVFADAIQPNEISGLMDGDFLEISGEINAAGVIEASRVERESDDSDFEVTGVISALDAPGFRFVINGLTVDYAAARLDGFDTDGPQVGDRVEVEGDQIDAAGVLISDEVELESFDYDGAEGDLVDIEGVVTAVLSAEQFELGGQAVVLGSQTVFEGGVAADIALGSRLEVSGTLDANGVLQADEIEFEDDELESPIGLQGIVDEIDAGNTSVVILGVTIRISSETRLEGDDDMPLIFEEISIGDVLEVRGVPALDDAAVLAATRVELEDADDEVRVIGPVQSLANPQLTVFGVVITTTTETEFDADGISSVAEFFDVIALDEFVEIEGTFDGATVSAAKVELESD